MFEDIFQSKKGEKKLVEKARFDMKEVYKGRTDIIARGSEMALEDMGLDMKINVNKFVDRNGDDRIEFVFSLYEGD